MEVVHGSRERRAEPKKLEAAAVHWARGGKASNDEALADAKFFGGAPSEFLDSLKSEETEFEVDEENWPVVRLFMRVQTQWRVGMNGPVGLDYVALESVSRLSGLEISADVFDGIQLMENAALKAMRAK